MFYLLVVDKFFFLSALFVLTIHDFCLENFIFFALYSICFGLGIAASTWKGGMRKNLG